MSPGSPFEPTGSEIVWQGRVLTVGVAHFRHVDGAVVARDKVWHPGAVGIVAVDETHVWLTRQPREVSGMTASLEIPAGKLDVPGEPPLACARRELDEEIAKAARDWSEIRTFYSSPGFTDEHIWLYLAQGLSDTSGEAAGDEDERIEIVPWPLDELDGAIEQTEDAKTVIGLQWLALRLCAGEL
jgi:8-oxo-dGTP pyrophosphatase MutT (NUDIX family)